TMFRRAAEVLTPGGRVLVVANRRLPYEQALRAIGRCRIVDETAGFKIIEVVS
ncbi:MAG: methyltransferase, partial [Planctomycetes bacterium]|nr:methyltransferase [Planctomycetota bacterium]